MTDPGRLKGKTFPMLHIVFIFGFEFRRLLRYTTKKTQYSNCHEMASTLPTFVLALVVVVDLTVLVDTVAPAGEFWCIGEPNLESCEICSFPNRAHL